jgi:hypothetical protein
MILPETFPVYLTADISDAGDHTSKQINIYSDAAKKNRVGVLMKMGTDPLRLDFDTANTPLIAGDPRLTNLPQIINWMISVLNGQSNEFEALLASLAAYDLANDGTPFSLEICDVL